MKSLISKCVIFVNKHSLLFASILFKTNVRKISSTCSYIGKNKYAHLSSVQNAKRKQ